MSILIDNKIPKSLIIDNKTVAKIYINDKLAWGAEEPFPEIDPNGPLTFIKTDAGEGSIQLKNYGTPLYTKTFQINKNDTGWEVYDIENTPVTMNKGDVLQIKSTSSTAISSSTSKYRYFTTVGKYLCGGQTNSLRNSIKNVSGSYAWYRLFYNTNITSAPVLDTTLTTLSDNCYSNMFYGCNSLKTAPELPSTTLANYCYSCMFQGCTSLVKVPELPATTLANYCYSSMFNGCSSLVNAPELPATTLAPYCYQRMFFGCTSLVKAPELPVTTLADYCYSNMFNGCTALVNAPKLPATTLTNSCYASMFLNCASLTTSPELSATTLVSSCYASMFNGCSSLVNAPELPATTLASSCYVNMFRYCTGLTVSPKIYAETITNTTTMNNMFNGCTNLKEIYCNARYVSGTTEITTQIGGTWLNGVPNTTDCIFHKNPNWSGPTSRGNATIPTNWQIVDWIDDEQW